MSEPGPAEFYRAYIDCLNGQDWSSLGQFVDGRVVHNGRPLGLGGYREILEGDFSDIPDLRFVIDILTPSARHIGSRLVFDCSPRGVFLGLPVMGRRVRFAEHAFYGVRSGRIVEVWSIIDKAAIESQLAGSDPG